MFVEQMAKIGVDMIALDSVKGEFSGLGLTDCDIPGSHAELQSARAYAESAGVFLEGPLFSEVFALLSTQRKACAGAI